MNKTQMEQALLNLNKRGVNIDNIIESLENDIKRLTNDLADERKNDIHDIIKEDLDSMKDALIGWKDYKDELKKSKQNTYI